VHGCCAPRGKTTTHLMALQLFALPSGTPLVVTREIWKRLVGPWEILGVSGRSSGRFGVSLELIVDTRHCVIICYGVSQNNHIPCTLQQKNVDVGAAFGMCLRKCVYVATMCSHWPGVIFNRKQSKTNEHLLGFMALCLFLGCVLALAKHNFGIKPRTTHAQL
jgi:hypothetical protein